MKKYIITLLLTTAWSQAQAYTIYASLVSSDPGPGIGTKVCTYETTNGFQFQLLVNRGICPRSVKYDTQTGQVSY